MLFDKERSSIPRVMMADESGESGQSDLESELNRLREEHRDLDSAIDALSNMTTSDDVQLARLKKRKLRLKDEIKILEDQSKIAEEAARDGRNILHPLDEIGQAWRTVRAA